MAAGLTLALTGERRSAVWLSITTALALLAGQGYMQLGMVFGFFPSFLVFLLDGKLRLCPVWKGFALVDVKGAQGRIPADDPSPWIEVLHREAAERVESLAIMLANEKAEHVQDQRRAIRKLGEEGVRWLVVRILGSLALSDYRAKEVAREFGLSQATLSRFAGTRWGQGLGGPDSVQVPGLWRNLAHLLAREPEFLAAAIEARVLRRLRQTLALIGGQLLEDEHGF